VSERRNVGIGRTPPQRRSAGSSRRRSACHLAHAEGGGDLADSEFVDRIGSLAGGLQDALRAEQRPAEDLGVPPRGDLERDLDLAGLLRQGRGRSARCRSAQCATCTSSRAAASSCARRSAPIRANVSAASCPSTADDSPGMRVIAGLLMDLTVGAGSDIPGPRDGSDPQHCKASSAADSAPLRLEQTRHSGHTRGSRGVVLLMTMRLALLGDSIAYGVGATHQCDTLAPRLTRGLAAASISVATRVHAVPGARTRDLAAQVRRASAWSPDVAVIVVGANDLGHRVVPDRAAEDLRAAVRTLTAEAVEVVVAPAPDLSVVPDVPVAMRPLVRAASQALRREQVRAVLEEGGRLADADDRTSRAFGRDPSLFSADRFHPSSAGYQVVYEGLLPVVLQAVRVREQLDERSP
jgi:lysophospholipase L1-like esterase